MDAVVEKLTDEELAAWCDYEPCGQFKENMSFARFNGMLKHAFVIGYRARLINSTPTEGDAEHLRRVLRAARPYISDKAGEGIIGAVNDALSAKEGQ